jgi:hypothetical protein
MPRADISRRAARCAELARAAADRAAVARDEAQQAGSRATELRVLTDACLKKHDSSTPPQK